MQRFLYSIYGYFHSKFTAFQIDARSSELSYSDQALIIYNDIPFNRWSAGELVAQDHRSSFMHASKMVSKGAGGGKSRNMNISIGLLRPKDPS